jgi:hypothetical protein
MFFYENLKEKFGDIKGVSWICRSKTVDWLIDWCLMPTVAVFQLYRLYKDAHYNGQKKKDKQWSTKHYTELQIEQCEPV